MTGINDFSATQQNDISVEMQLLDRASGQGSAPEAGRRALERPPSMFENDFSADDLLRNAKLQKSSGLSSGQSSALKKLSLARIGGYLGDLFSAAGKSLVKGFRAVRNFFAGNRGAVPSASELKELKNVFSIGLESGGEEGPVSQSISYKDFKNLFTLGIGSMGDQKYGSLGEFYQALSAKHRETIFKPYEEMVNKLCGKLGDGDPARGEALLRKAVADIRGSCDPKNGLHAELFSCLFRDLSNAPDAIKDTADKSPADILKFLDRQLMDIVRSHVLGSTGKPEGSAVPPVVAQPQPQQSPAVDPEMAQNFLFQAGPDAESDGFVVARLNDDKTGLAEAFGELSQDKCNQLIVTYGREKIADMVSKVTGIPADSIKQDYQVRTALFNCLFIKGAESGNKLMALLDSNGTYKDLQDLVNARVDELKQYLQDPSKIPNLVVEEAEGAGDVPVGRQNGPYVCNCDTGKYQDRTTEALAAVGTWLTSYGAPCSKSAMDFVTMVDPLAKNVADMVSTVDKCKNGQIFEVNNGRVNDMDVLNGVSAVVTAVDPDKVFVYATLEEVTNDFVAKFGADAVNRIVESVGGEVDPDNTTPTLELIRVIFSHNSEGFDGHTKTLAGTAFGYSDNIAGLADIFIDGINAYAQKLGLQPVNS